MNFYVRILWHFNSFIEKQTFHSDGLTEK